MSVTCVETGEPNHPVDAGAGAVIGWTFGLEQLRTRSAQSAAYAPTRRRQLRSASAEMAMSAFDVHGTPMAVLAEGGRISSLSSWERIRNLAVRNLSL